ncbi:MAG: 7-cyano-7-deazaguanine synthase [Halobacteriales archaeon]
MKGLLYSGGVESAYLLQTLDGRIQPVYVSYGFPWEEREREAARDHVESVGRAEPLMVIDVEHGDPSRLRRDADETEKDYTYVHGRSPSLITNAAVELSAMGVTDIYEGTLASGDDRFPDSSREFYGAVERALSLGLDADVRVHTPLYGMLKPEVVAALVEHDGPIGFDDTVSCVVPGDSPCGDCYKCHERREAREDAEELL